MLMLEMALPKPEIPLAFSKHEQRRLRGSRLTQLPLPHPADESTTIFPGHARNDLDHTWYLLKYTQFKFATVRPTAGDSKAAYYFPCIAYHPIRVPACQLVFSTVNLSVIWLQVGVPADKLN